MKIFAEVRPYTLSQSIHRVYNALKIYKPSDVEFTGIPEEADLCFLHVVGVGSLGQLSHIPLEKQVFIQYCYLTTEEWYRSEWPNTWSKVNHVFSYYNLPSIIQQSMNNFTLIPMGYNPAVFNYMPTEKRYLCLVTGYVSESEYIREVYDACVELGGDCVHVGPDFGWGKHYVNFNGISDAAMCSLYRQSRWVAGMRISEGFELPALEGLACGIPAIILDMPCYRDWYGESNDVYWVNPSEPVYPQIVKAISTIPQGVASSLPYTWDKVTSEIWASI